METSGNRGRNVSNLEGLGGGGGEIRKAELQTEDHLITLTTKEPRNKHHKPKQIL